MYIYGKNVVTDYLKNNKKIQKAYIYKKFNDEFILSAIQKRNIETKFMEKIELDKLANPQHQGIILSVPDFEYTNIEDLLTLENPLIVILDHIEDPHNFGAIIRTCEAAGISGIIIPKDRSVLVNSTVIKVSTGAINHIKIACVTNLTQTIKKLKQAGFWIIEIGRASCRERV